ncbi:hypothetical protein NE237_023982 [Protea cynaroides]|uniref:Uncharacterized protein n=1 Tax=Protea cynaroides TaxID=273540 RepID=A0A9Q0HFY1_9MAGN|nr:hypothetical protein NE237_023982 [Protea cynaroides]
MDLRGRCSPVGNVIADGQGPLNNGVKDENSERSLELFLKIGLDEKTAWNTIANNKVTANLNAVIQEAAVIDGCSRVVGNLLYMIKTPAQLEAAFSFFGNIGPDKFPVKEFEEACGVGVEVCAEEIECIVTEVFEENKGAILEQRYRTNDMMIQTLKLKSSILIILKKLSNGWAGSPSSSLPLRITYSSDYFQDLYDLAVELICRGHAYVDPQTPEEIKEYQEKKMSSPRRDRPIAESLKLFNEMKLAMIDKGKATLRMKQDMQSEL